MTLQQILTAIASLDVEDVQTVQNYCEVILQSSPVNSSEDWLLDAILKEITNRGLSYTVPEHFRIRNSKAYKGYIRKSNMIRSQLTNALGGNPWLVERVALGSRVAGLLADYLEPTYDLSLDILLMNVDQIPQAIEASFPGYIQNGLLRMLLRPAKEWCD